VIDRYTVQPLPIHTAAGDAAQGAVQTFSLGGPVPVEWWTLFRCEALDALVERARNANPGVQSAQAALREANEIVLAAWGVSFPAVDASAGASRQKISGAQAGLGNYSSIYNLFNASVNVSYGLDMFGGARRTLESMRSQSDYQHFALEATYLTLSANVVTTAVAEASLRAQILHTERMIEASRVRLDLIYQRQQAGLASAAEVFAQQAELGQYRATLPILRNELERQRALLATLLGQVPSDQPEATFQLSDLHLPDSVPVSLSSQLVSQRPDVRQQEELLHQASAQIGVATSNMLPQITLSGGYGSASLASNSLLNPASLSWGIAAGIVQPLVHGGQFLHMRRAAVAAYEEAAAQYRQAVLCAFRDVAESLQALTADAESVNALSEAEEAAAASLDTADRFYRQGTVGYLMVLTAQRTEHQVDIALIQAQAARLADTAALFHALGGGWWTGGASASEKDAVHPNDRH
jgi:NodT family efflux transporter outer membrane factor (OMF) lipoprotein